MRESKANIVFEESSGNVFRDLNLPKAEELQLKFRIMIALNRIMEERGHSQKQAAQTLGVNQPKIFALQNCKPAGFSVERLLRFALALDCDVRIQLTPRSIRKKAGKVPSAIAA